MRAREASGREKLKNKKTVRSQSILSFLSPFSIKHNINSNRRELHRAVTFLIIAHFPQICAKYLQNTYIFSILQSGVYKTICKMLKFSGKRKIIRKMFVLPYIVSIFASSNKQNHTYYENFQSNII